MPRLNELEYYFRGLWMLVMGRLEGFGWLDFSDRGFWRSWWAIAYCLPPLALSWAGKRAIYLSSLPDGATAGPVFVAKLMAIDASGWVVSYLALAVVMTVTGYNFQVRPVITAVNWLTVPIQWLMVLPSLVEVFAPLNSDLLLSVTLTLLIVSAFAHFLVIRQLVDRKALPAAAFLLTLVVATLWSTSVIGDALGIWLS
jgi:hypothetical protein